MYIKKDKHTFGVVAFDFSGKSEEPKSYKYKYDLYNNEYSMHSRSIGSKHQLWATFKDKARKAIFYSEMLERFKKEGIL